MWKRTLSLAALVVVCSLTAFGQAPVRVGGELFVGSYGGFYPASVDVDSSGGFVVAWSKSGYPTEIKARRFSSTGVGGADILVAASSYSSSAYPPADVAMADDGTFVVVWDTGSSVGARVFNSGGSPIVGPLSIGYSGSSPSVSMNKSTGDFVVAWTGGTFALANGTPGFVQKLSASGAPIGSTYTFGTSPSVVDVAMDRGGNFVVTWLEESIMGPPPNPYARVATEDYSKTLASRRRAGTDSSIAANAAFGSGMGPYGASFNPSGSPINPQFTVGSYGTYAYSPSIAPVGGGNFVIAWETEGAGYCSTDVKAAIVHGDGTIVKNEFTVDQQSYGYQGRPSVAGNGSGFVVAWESSILCGKALPSPEQDGSSTAVVARPYNLDAVPLSDEFIVNTTTLGPQFNAAVGMNGLGQFVVAWSNGYAYPASIYAQMFGAGATPPPPPPPPDPEPCKSGKPTALSPSGSATVSSPVTFSWTGVVGATGYAVFLSSNNGPFTQIATTVRTSTTKTLSPGSFEWYVAAYFGVRCPAYQSTVAKFTVEDNTPPPTCELTKEPLPAIPGESTTGESYEFSWSSVTGAASYQVQESPTESFAGAQTMNTSSNRMTFKKSNVITPTPYFYRVRGVAECDSAIMGPYSKVVRIVILPKPVPSSTNPLIVTQFGNSEPVSTVLFIPGFGSAAKTTPFAASFIVTSSAPWLTVAPGSGELPPNGTTVILTADPTLLDLGANSATVTVTRNDGLGKTTSGASTSSVPVSVSLVSPISPLAKETTPPPNALIIPAVANVGGFQSKWLSDVRINNTSNSSIQYQLTFTATETDGTIEGKKTGYTLKPGQTVAMDDIVRQWFGLGDLADGTNGTLEIRPLNFQGLEATPEASLAATVATSRTYTRDSNSLASYGQFMPTVPFANFINATLPGARLSMQQVSQDLSSRTNFGLVEGSGKPVDVLLTVYDRLGTKLGTFPVSLLAGEHRQINSLLAQNNITVVDGRVEATVTGGSGAITAYASIVASGTGDPTLILGTDPASISSNKYVLAGVADLVNGNVNWRSDLRIFNGGSASQTAQLFFYQQGSTTAVGPVSITVAPNEVRVLDSVVRTQFGLQNTGGAVHVVTPDASSLVITGETFSSNATGKFGQTIEGVTIGEAVGVSDRPLQILQLEDSAQYRTNLGLAEMTGKAVTVQVQLVIPLSLSAPVTTVQLGANEFKQLNGIVRSLAGKDVYNARIAVKVTGGEGKILAYGSVVDNKTLDATYVPGQ